MISREYSSGMENDLTLHAVINHEDKTMKIGMEWKKLFLMKITLPDKKCSVYANFSQNFIL